MSAPLIYRLQWDGIGVTVRHCPDQWNIIDHIEVMSDNRVPLPITETGYRSHFLNKALIEPYGDAAAFVLAWLEEEARSAEWQTYKLGSQQLSLF
jgi:hypothetical protein